MSGIRAVGFASVVAFVVVLGLSDAADASHAVWRDPISYFGSGESPYPSAFNVTLGLVGVSIVLSVLLSRATFRPALAMASGAAGASMIGLAIWPIDCSPTDELCEVIIRGGVVSTSHDVHSLFAVVLFVACVCIASIVAAETWRAGPKGAGQNNAPRARAAIFLGVTVVALLWIVGRPFARGTAIAEVLAVAAALLAFGEHRRSVRLGA